MTLTAGIGKLGSASVKLLVQIILQLEQLGDRRPPDCRRFGSVKTGLKMGILVGGVLGSKPEFFVTRYPPTAAYISDGGEVFTQRTHSLDWRALLDSMYSTLTYTRKQVTKTGDTKTGDRLYCTPKVRHAEGKEMGDTYRP
jgi:hypothetical protein